MKFTISRNNKGKNCLMSYGYIYRVDSTLMDGSISSRCTSKKSKGRVKTDSKVAAIVPVQLEHNHGKYERKHEKLQLRAQVKRKATDDMTTRPSELIRTELHTFFNNVLESGGTINLPRKTESVSCILYRKSREEVYHALNSMTTTTTKESGVVIIPCITNLTLLANIAEIFVDGTFKGFPVFINMDYVMGIVFHWCMSSCQVNLRRFIETCGSVSLTFLPQKMCNLEPQ